MQACVVPSARCAKLALADEPASAPGVSSTPALSNPMAQRAGPGARRAPASARWPDDEARAHDHTVIVDANIQGSVRKKTRIIASTTREVISDGWLEVKCCSPKRVHHSLRSVIAQIRSWHRASPFHGSPTKAKAKIFAHPTATEVQ